MNDCIGCLSCFTGSRSSYIDLTRPHRLDGVRIVNFMDGGGPVNSIGVQRVRVHVTTTDPTAVYEANVTDQTLVCDGVVPRMVWVDGATYTPHDLPVVAPSDRIGSDRAAACAVVRVPTWYSIWSATGGTAAASVCVVWNCVPPPCFETAPGVHEWRRSEIIIQLQTPKKGPGIPPHRHGMRGPFFWDRKLIFW